MIWSRISQLRDKHQLYRLAGMMMLFAVWEVAGRTGLANGMVPTFGEAMLVVYQRLMDGTFLRHTIPTLTRTYAGFLGAAAVAIPLGLVIGWSDNLESLFDVLIDFLRNLSSITLIPITILIIGIGFTQKVTLIAYAAFFPILLNTMRGVSSTDKSMIEAARSMGADNYEVMRHVIIPSALPNIFTGLRLSISVAFIVVIAAELVGASSGLGYYLMQAERTYLTTDVFATAFYISVLGYISNKIVVLTGEKVLSWKTYTVDKV